MGSWVKKRYPEAYRDLCTAFIDRGFSLGAANGYSAMVTMQSWMFLGSFEKLRCRILGEHSVSSMAHLGTRAFGAIAGEVVSTAATVFANAKTEVEGTYFRLVDMGSEAEKREGLLQALADPDCGWFYRADARGFGVIPGRPVAYWASDSMLSAFARMPALSQFATPRQGLATTDNNRFLRRWWEISKGGLDEGCASRADAASSGARWFPIIRGGAFRKWFGTYDEVVDWLDDGREMKREVLRRYPYLKTPDFVIKNQGDYFKPAVTWSKISSGDVSFRFAPAGMLFEVAGACMFADEEALCIAQGLCNSSVALQALSILAPTLNYEVGQIASLPFPRDLRGTEGQVVETVRLLRAISKKDIDDLEGSRDFTRSSLT